MNATTPQRLQEAAETLLLDRGQAATTLRDITELADANVAAVNYHFGSKDALLATVFRSALAEVTEIQRTHLAALPEDASLEDIVRVWLSPALDEQDPREARLWTLIQRGMAERAPGLIENMDEVKKIVDDHLIERLSSALPHLGREELMLRHAAVLGAMSALNTGAMHAMVPSDSPDVADRMVAWIVGGLQAPAAGSV